MDTKISNIKNSKLVIHFYIQLQEDMIFLQLPKPWICVIFGMYINTWEPIAHFYLKASSSNTDTGTVSLLGCPQ